MPQARFGIVSAVYNVARYLDDFLGSLDKQTFDHNHVEIVLVNDGSTDDSLSKLEAWKAATDYQVHIITQENAGQSAARNTGIECVSSEWVTFTDPDDILDDDYLDAIDQALRKNPQSCLAISHLHDYFETNEEVKDSHPLRKRFRGGDQMVDADRFPEYIHLHVASAFFERRFILDKSIRFDVRIRPTFEDAHFTQVYLLHCARRLISVVDSAKYYYRRRADNTSTLQTSVSDARRYTDVLEYGCLDLLERAGTRPPLWLQYAILYELTWSLKGDEAISSPTSGLSESTTDRFHHLVGEIVSRLDRFAVDSFAIVRRSTSLREALLHGYSHLPWRWESIVAVAYDKSRGLVQLRYHFTGTQPVEEYWSRGKRVRPWACKTRAISFMRRTLVRERIIWLPADGTLAVSLDAEPVAISFSWPRPPVYSVRPAQLATALADLEQGEGGLAVQRGTVISPRAGVIRRNIARRLFANAWVLMDRDENANDNAEHLFRYLRKHRRDINAWFVLRKDSPDWARLKRDGFKRLIAYGSPLWRILCSEGGYIISSHADRYVYDPEPLRSFGGVHWRFVFLQHGVTHNDISRWLNTKRIAAMVTATSDEYASIAGDGSNYELTSNEVSLTGFPRHDNLKILKESSPVDGAPRLVTIMPTWRQFLSGAPVRGGNGRSIDPEFFQSDFIRRWLDFLWSEQVKSLSSCDYLRIVFMPHPNLEPYLSGLSIPPYVDLVRYTDRSVQEVLVESAVVITDYSSVVFDAAVIRTPVLYYQFDRESVFSGSHLTRPGYFSYVDDGFGPVADTPEELRDCLKRIVESGFVMEEQYSSRVDAAFGTLDGKACERTVRMIEALDVPVSPRDCPKRVENVISPGTRFYN